MNDRSKAQLQNAALAVAEFEHSEDAKIKPLIDKRNDLQQRMNEAQATLQGLQKEKQELMKALRVELLPFINEKLK